MALKSYIQDLLYRYDCVIVPEFGGFIANKVGAIIEGSTIYPPSKRISFNAQLSHNDGLFVNHVASIEKISYEDAQTKVAKAVNKWKSQLKTQPLLIDGLGTLTTNAENQLNFEPNEKINFDKNSFGFVAINSAKISQEVVLDSKIEAFVPAIEVKEKKENVVKFGSFLKYVAGAAILVAGFTGINKYNKSVQLQQLANERDVIEQKIQKATFIINDQLPTVNLDVVKENDFVYIIAGAFQLEKNAEKKLKQLKNKGYDNATIIGKNEWGLTQVSVGSYASKEAADKAIESIRKEVSFDAWILVKED